MTANPWLRLPEAPPFVLPEDASLVRDFNARASRNHYLHTETLLPEPFLGSPDAPVVLLSNNPGFREQGVPFKQDPAFVARMRNNLRHGPSDCPFLYLAADFRGPGRRWWEVKLKHLIHRFGIEIVSRSLFEVVLIPYPSRRFRQPREWLPSQEYGFHLVRQSVSRGAVIVLMRGERRWMEAVPELKTYQHLRRLINPQQPAISPGNCRDFDKVAEAISRREGIG